MKTQQKTILNTQTISKTQQQKLRKHKNNQQNHKQLLLKQEKLVKLTKTIKTCQKLINLKS